MDMMDCNSWELLHERNILLVNPTLNSEGVLKTLIQVHNLTCQKTAGVRVTLNNWQSHIDIQAQHVMTEGNLDVFQVEEKIDTLTKLDERIAPTIEIVGFVEYPNFTSWSRNPADDSGNHKITFSRSVEIATQKDAPVYIKDISINDISNEMKVKILAKNIAFDKTVGLRISEDAWASNYDITGTYAGSSHEQPDYDEFFVILPINANIQFASYYYPGDSMQGYWDDNNSLNHAVSSMKIKIE